MSLLLVSEGVQDLVEMHESCSINLKKLLQVTERFKKNLDLEHVRYANQLSRIKIKHRLNQKNKNVAASDPIAVKAEVAREISKIIKQNGKAKKLWKPPQTLMPDIMHAVQQTIKSDESAFETFKLSKQPVTQMFKFKVAMQTSYPHIFPALTKSAALLSDFDPYYNALDLKQYLDERDELERKNETQSQRIVLSNSVYQTNSVKSQKSACESSNSRIVSDFAVSNPQSTPKKSITFGSHVEGSGKREDCADDSQISTRLKMLHSPDVKYSRFAFHNLKRNHAIDFEHANQKQKFEGILPSNSALARSVSFKQTGSSTLRSPKASSTQENMVASSDCFNLESDKNKEALHDFDFTHHVDAKLIEKVIDIKINKVGSEGAVDLEEPNDVETINSFVPELKTDNRILGSGTVLQRPLIANEYFVQLEGKNNRPEDTEATELEELIKLKQKTINEVPYGYHLYRYDPSSNDDLSLVMSRLPGTLSNVASESRDGDKKIRVENVEQLIGDVIANTSAKARQFLRTIEAEARSANKDVQIKVKSALPVKGYSKSRGTGKYEFARTSISKIH